MTTNSTAARASTPKLALWLVGATLAYNVIEAIIAIAAGAEAESIALLGFGFDSVIEVAAATVLLWRLSLEVRNANVAEIEAAEHRVHRFVGWTFLALALYVTMDAGRTLWQQDVPEETMVGIILGAVSLVLMPLIALWKLRVAADIQSAALRAEAKETLACSYLSATLLFGLGANALFGWWWADPIAALLMVPWLIKEGREGLEGEGCCA